MLIINADDYGSKQYVTDRILYCYETNRITSASTMVFMADSERAAELAIECGLDVGLHLNFTDKFTGNVKLPLLNKYHHRVATFLLGKKYSFIFYNPLLKKPFDYVFKAQYEEFERLYNRIPTHINGHHHMHLCANILIDRIIPPHFKVRRNFTFATGEKDSFNRFYRYLVDLWLTRRYTCTDFFFSISPFHELQRLKRIVRLAISSNVELMVHPQKPEEYDYLMTAEYLNIIADVKKGSYATL